MRTGPLICGEWSRPHTPCPPDSYARQSHGRGRPGGVGRASRPEQRPETLSHRARRLSWYWHYPSWRTIRPRAGYPRGHRNRKAEGRRDFAVAENYVPLPYLLSTILYPG